MPLNTLSGLSLRDLEYAVAVADLNHFGRAADQCGVSQAGLSEQVRKLESLLGCPLFERTPRRVTVTPDGEIILRQARQILTAAKDLLNSTHTNPLAGPLRLGVIATLGPYYVPRLLHHVRAKYPDMTLQLQEGLTDKLIRALAAGDQDLLLIAMPPPSDAIAAEPLFFEPFRAMLPANHPLARQPTLSLSDLATNGLLLLEEGHCLREQALSLCGTPTNANRFASSLEMLRHMIAAGEGHSLVPLLAADQRTDLDGLVALRPIGDPGVGRTITLAFRSSDPRAAAFRAFAGFLRAVSPPTADLDYSLSRDV